MNNIVKNGNNLLFIIFFVQLIKADKVCSSDKNEQCNVSNINRYSKEANTKHEKYLHFIESAKEKYIPCSKSKCGCHLPVIDNDLNTFLTGITKQMIDNVKSKGVKYQIIDHHLYRDETCKFPARCSGVEHFLLELLPTLPDVEFILNTRDFPEVHKHHGVLGPIFSFSKTPEYYDVLYPAWSFWEGGPAISLYPTGIGRWDRHRKSLALKSNDTSWDDKIPKVFFRGSRTNSERDTLVLLSREKPELVDAQYTKNQAWKSEADTLYQPPASEVPFEDHCKYKYLFNFRGVAASFRFKFILLCKSLVFHVGDEWLEFFYPSLKPWIHYIPVEANASKEELEQLLHFVKGNDDMAKEIALNGYEMIWNNLKMSDVTCYWRRLLKKYAYLLRFKVERDKGLIEVK